MKQATAPRPKLIAALAAYSKAFEAATSSRRAQDAPEANAYLARIEEHLIDKLDQLTLALSLWTEHGNVIPSIQKPPQAYDATFTDSKGSNILALNAAKVDDVNSWMASRQEAE